jgi:hypothetical protein
LNTHSGNAAWALSLSEAPVPGIYFFAISVLLKFNIALAINTNFLATYHTYANSLTVVLAEIAHRLYLILIRRQFWQFIPDINFPVLGFYSFASSVLLKFNIALAINTNFLATYYTYANFLTIVLAEIAHRLFLILIRRQLDLL